MFLSSLKRNLWEMWGEPALSTMGLYQPDDLTYGRTEVPFSPMERRLHQNPDVDVWFGKAYMTNGKDFVWYQVWEDKFAQRKTGRKADMIFVHGTGVHSGTLASHSRRYLDAGFRLIVPDLISHGYSTGLHVYQRHVNAYTECLWSVLHDVARRDDDIENGGVRRTKAERRSTFMLGLSFGGMVAHMYCLNYPHSLREDPEDEWEIPIDGVIGVGPIVNYSQTNVTLGPKLRYFIAFLDTFVGAARVEVIVPHKKCLDKDPKVYKTLVSEDMRSHQGAFRAGHLLCIHFCAEDLRARAHEIKHPTFVQQGGQDRVACHEAAIDFVRNISSEDKRMVIYPVCQHVIYRKAKTEEEDQAGRVACIEDNLAWMCERAPAFGALHRQTSFTSDVTLINEGGPMTPALSDTSSINDGILDSATRPQTPLTPMSATMELEAAAAATTNNKQAPAVPSAFFNNFESSANAGVANTASKSEQARQQAALEHPLLAKAHPTTLPLLARLAPERTYRPGWTMHPALQPYDIGCEYPEGAAIKKYGWESLTFYESVQALFGKHLRHLPHNVGAKEFWKLPSIDGASTSA